jgi:signal transduction histidine kinase
MDSNTKYHRLLERQIKVCFPDKQITPENYDKFLSLIDEGYKSFDEQREVTERAITISQQELEDLNINLIKKNDFLDAFNHGMAHDIKNHSSNIIGLMHMLKKYNEFDDKDKINQIISFLDLSANQLTIIVQGFLFLSQSEKLSAKDFNKIDKNELQNSIISEIRYLTIRKKTNLNFKLNFNELFYSKHILNIILVNLISNSIKYSKTQVNSIIDVSISNDNSNVYLEIIDNGIGMNLDDKNSRIFKLFNRESKHQNIKGYGIGLYLVKKVIELNEGKIEFKSEVNVGTAIYITLPINN